jgi:transposase InsO family protein
MPDKYFLDDEMLLYKYIDDEKKQPRVCVSVNMVPTILKICHNTPLAGHRGIRKMTVAIQGQFYWPNMTTAIKKFCSECKACIKFKMRVPPPPPLQQFKELDKPFQTVSWDIVGPLKITSSSNRYILTVQDRFTRFVEAKAIPDQTAETVARGLIELVISRYGTPQALLSDRGRNFTSNLMRRLTTLLRVSQIFCTPWHPQANGGLERSHKDFSSVIAQFVTKDAEWDELIVYALFVYRTTIHSATNHTPSMMLFGREVQFPWADILTPTEPNYAIDEDYVEQVKQRLRIAHESAKIANRQAVERNHNYLNHF